jgi:hypothetical protein
MKYQVHAKVAIEGEGLIINKGILLSSELPLTAKQIKEQSFAKVKLEDKYIKVSDELRYRGIGQQEASLDSEVYNKDNQRNLEYQLTVKLK